MDEHGDVVFPFARTRARVDDGSVAWIVSQTNLRLASGFRSDRVATIWMLASVSCVLVSAGIWRMSSYSVAAIAAIVLGFVSAAICILSSCLAIYRLFRAKYLMHMSLKRCLGVRGPIVELSDVNAALEAMKWTFRRRDQLAIAEKVAEALTTLTVDGCVHLSDSARKALVRIIIAARSPVGGYPTKRLVLSCLNAIAVCRCTAHLVHVRRLDADVADEEIRRAARECIESLQEFHQNRVDGFTLVRPTAPNSRTDSDLLRISDSTFAGISTVESPSESTSTTNDRKH